MLKETAKIILLLLDRFAQRLLHENENVRIIDGGMLLHAPVLYKKLDDQFHNVLNEKFGVGADAEHLVSYRLTKDHVLIPFTVQCTPEEAIPAVTS